MTTAEVIARIREMLAKATPGPWKAFESGAWGGEGFGVAMPAGNISERDDADKWFSCRSTSSESAETVLLIEAAPTELARLADALEVAERALENIGRNNAFDVSASAALFRKIDQAREARAEMERILNENA